MRGSGRGSEPVASTLSPPASASILPGLRLLPVSRCLIFFLSLESGSRTSMSVWVGADGGPRGFDRFGARAQREPGAIGYPVGAQEGYRSFIRLLIFSFLSFSRRRRPRAVLHRRIVPFRPTFPVSVFNVGCLCVCGTSTSFG
jgi:hypothetical protein